MEYEYAEKCITERVAFQASADMVSHVALSRYFQLLNCGRAALRGMFSAYELCLLLNANPQPWWSENLFGETVWTVADAIYWSYMDEADATPEVEVLLQKVQSLNLVQRLALTDVLECAWRSSNPEAYAPQALA